MESSQSPKNMQSSPPETPVEGKKRFQDLNTQCESIEDYLPGGYHPVHLNDTFKGQYKVVRKLGDGGSSTVWLAFDIKLVVYLYNQYAIISANKSDFNAMLL